MPFRKFLASRILTVSRPSSWGLPGGTQGGWDWSRIVRLPEWRFLFGGFYFLVELELGRQLTLALGRKGHVAVLETPIGLLFVQELFPEDFQAASRYPRRVAEVLLSQPLCNNFSAVGYIGVGMRNGRVGPPAV
jgi:hypothetical protein